MTTPVSLDFTTYIDYLNRNLLDSYYFSTAN